MAETPPPPQDQAWLRIVFKTGEFKDDMKRLGRGVHRKAIIAELPAIIELLANDHPLPAALRDHPLSGTFNDCRDLHIRGDLVLIYRKTVIHKAKTARKSAPATRPELHLVRIGSHSELFKK